MSATIMSEAAAIAQHLQLHVAKGGTLYFSGFMHALAEARRATSRDVASGRKLPESHGKHGSWLGAVGYFALLDQIGKCFRPRGSRRVAGKPIAQALRHFSDLSAAEIDALYALRCAFAHDYSLINVHAKQSLQHAFIVGQGTGCVVALPSKSWNGDLTARDRSCTTQVSLEAVGDLVEDVVGRLRDAASRGKLEVALPGGADELVHRYLFAAGE